MRAMRGEVTTERARRVSAVSVHTVYIIMAENGTCLIVFNESWKLPEDVLRVVFAFLVDPQSVSSIQQTCRTTRRWKYDTLHQWKLDWVYKNMEVFLGAEETKRLRDGSLTSISLYDNKIGAEGGKAIGEGLKVNTSLTSIHLRNNTIGAEGRGALRETREVNAGCNIDY